jgi:hypothetical protein
MSRYWLEHCPPPRPRPAELAWDVFISYRSVNRPWAIALYDMLTEAGYRTFLDQYVLVAGQLLASQLQDNLRKSASGVLLWSQYAADSRWVEREHNAMLSRADNTRESACAFYMVVAKLDAEALPPFADASLYVDFASYPHGPSGAELVRLVCGLGNRPLDEAAMQRILLFEDQVREEPARLHASTAAGLYEDIETRALAGTPAYTTSATLPALAADRLIAGGRYDAALRVIEHARQTFRKSLRLRQLEGLALRRLARTREAILALEMLRADGHQDPETLGMLGACWTDLWESELNAGAKRSARDALERARDLYMLAFETVPTDTYVGINAASKSALLGDADTARALSERLLARLAEERHHGRLAADYWTKVTEPEALLLCGEWDAALKLFHAARVAHQKETGSIETTGTQIRRLLSVLPVPEDIRKALEEEFPLRRPD